MSARNDEKFIAVRKAWDDGANLEEIAARFNYKLSGAKATLNRLGVSFAKNFDKEHEILRQMRMDGKSLIEMNEATGMPKCSISAYLKSVGLSTRQNVKHEAKKIVKAVKEENLTYAKPKQIKKVVDNGKRYDDVTDMLFQQYEG